MALGSFLRSPSLADVALILLIIGLIRVGSGWLEASADHLVTYHGLPMIVQGSIIVALESSFPEFTSIAIAAAAGAFDAGVGTIVGSAILNILVTLALSGLATDGDLEASRLVIYEEAQSYMVAVTTLVVIFPLAVIYFPVPDGPPLTGELTRPIVLIPLLLYGLYLFIRWQDVSEHGAEDADVTDSIGCEQMRPLGGLLVAFIGVERLVESVESLSATLGAPTSPVDVTVVAAVTSLPDTLVSVRPVADGGSATSSGDVLGSDAFDLLVAVPMGVLIVGSALVDFAITVPMLGVLTPVAVLLSGLLRTDLPLTRLESYALGTTYLAFVGWVIVETAGITLSPRS